MSKKTIYQPMLYNQDNIVDNLPQELHSFECFDEIEDLKDFMEEIGYCEYEYSIFSYDKDEIEDCVILDWHGNAKY